MGGAQCHSKARVPSAYSAKAAALVSLRMQSFGLFHARSVCRVGHTCVHSARALTCFDMLGDGGGEGGEGVIFVDIFYCF